MSNLRRNQEFSIFKCSNYLLSEGSHDRKNLDVSNNVELERQLGFAVNHWNSLLVAFLRHDTIAPMIWVFIWFPPIWARSPSAVALHPQAEMTRDVLLCLTDQPSAGEAPWWWVCQDSRCSLETSWCQTVPWTTCPTHPSCSLQVRYRVGFAPLSPAKAGTGTCVHVAWEGGRMYTMRTWGAAASVGILLSHTKVTALPILKFLFFPLFFPPAFYCWIQNAHRWEGRAQITLLLHMLEETRVQVRIFIWKQLRCNSLPPQLQADRKEAHAVVV